MCNMKLLIIELPSAQQEMIENDGGLNNVNVSEIGHTLAEIGDVLNDEALQKNPYYRLVAIGFVLTAFAAIMTLRRI